MSLATDLVAAKTKAALKEYEVTITEYLQKAVTICATSRDDAERIALEKWLKSEYVLDAGNFKDVEFFAAPENRSITAGRQRKGEPTL